MDGKLSDQSVAFIEQRRLDRRFKSYRDLAKDCGIHHGTISRLTGHRPTPTLEHLERLAKSLDSSPAERPVVIYVRDDDLKDD